MKLMYTAQYLTANQCILHIKLLVSTMIYSKVLYSINIFYDFRKAHKVYIYVYIFKLLHIEPFHLYFLIN